VLGLAAAGVATLLPQLFYRVRDLFRALPVPAAFKPALGGLGVGVIALVFPQVLGGGYGWIRDAIDGRLVLTLLLPLVFAKMAALALTISSGGSGGVFAPTLFIGAMLGGALSSLTRMPMAPFVVVGMAAVFGGAARVPIAALIMVTEMTASYRLLAPAAFAVFVAYLVQRWLTGRLGVKYPSLYEAQVAGRADSPARYLDQLRIALDLLMDRRIRPGSGGPVRPLDLEALLDSGIPVRLSGRDELQFRIVRAGDGLVGRPAGAAAPAAGERPFEIAAVFRGEGVVLPAPDTVLREGDRLLVIGARPDDAPQGSARSKA
jgi:CIC family chloride channel protein